MSRNKPFRILMTEDLSSQAKGRVRSTAVRLCADRIAERMKGKIDLVHVDFLKKYPYTVPHYQPLIDDFYRKQQVKLSKLASDLPHETQTHFVIGDPAEEIIALTKKTKRYQLLIQGTHGRKGASRLFLGSVAEEVIRNSPIPVLTIGPQAQVGNQDFLKQASPSILISTSLTENSEKAETYGIKIAKPLKARIILFHSLGSMFHPVIESAYYSPVASVEISKFFREARSQARLEMERKVKEIQSKGVSCVGVIEDRTPSAAAAILKETVKSKASLVIMGTHGRSFMEGAFFGRTARQIILEAPVPVLTVRSKRP